MSGEANAPLAQGQWRSRGAPLEVPGVRLLGELGRGARSVVYHVEYDGRPFALKTLAEPADAREAPAFAREAALLASLDHPGLVRIHEVGEYSGRPYMIMDLVDGRSLDRLLVTDRLDDVVAARIGHQVADALAAAHGAGLVHRDVKPANILVEPDGRVRLIDFGLAARAGNEAADVAAGTFVYSAPEQTGMLHRAVDGRADLYALGVVLFECLVGAPPFEASDAGELIRRHLTATPRNVRAVRPDAAPAMAAVIGRLLAKDPDDRYQTAEALKSDLVRIARGERDFALAVESGLVTAPLRPLVGRRTELARLTTALDHAIAGLGRAVIIEGAPGSGKTRLAREIAATAQAGGRLVLFGKGSADDAVPFGPLRVAVQQHLREISGLTPLRRPEAIAGLHCAAGEGVRLLAAYFPLLANLLSISDPAGDGGTPEDVADAADAERTFAEALAGFLVGLAEQHGGGVLQLEDAQWWDEATRRVIRHLAPMLAGSRLLLIVTGRNDPQYAPTLRALVADLAEVLDERLTVGPLPEPAVAALVATLLGERSVPAGLAARLTTRGAGNPLAISEYVRAALDAGLLRPSRGTWVLDEAGLDQLALPDGTIELLLRRIDGLGAGARRILTIAAVIGNRFAVDVVTRVAGAGRTGGRAGAEPATPETVAAALADAVRHRLVEPVSGGYAFLHDRIRETLVSHLTEADLRGLHQEIAEVLDADGGRDDRSVFAVAAHYLRGEPDRAPDRVFATAAAAGLRALGEYAASDAYELLAQAEETASTAGISPDGRFHAAFGTAAVRTGRAEVARKQLTLALAKERDPLRRAVLRGRIADAHHMRWEGRLAIEEAQRGLAEIGSGLPRNPLALALTSIWLAFAGFVIGLVPARLRIAHGAIRERYRLQNELTGLAAQGAATTMQIGRMIAYTLRSGYSAARLVNGPNVALHHAAKAMIASAAGRRRTVARELAASLAAAREVSDPHLVARVHSMAAVTTDVMAPLTATSGAKTSWVLEQHGRWLCHSDYLSSVDNLGALLLARGNLAEAVVWHQRGRQRAARDDAMGNDYAAFGARIAALRGRTAEAVERLRIAREFAASAPDDVSGTIAVALAATHVALEQGELGQPFEDAVAEFEALGKGPRQLWAHQQMFWVYRAFGRIAQAEAARPVPGGVGGQPETDFAERLRQAEVAVGTLRKVATGPVLRGYSAAAQAALAVLAGRPQWALRRLGRADGADGGLDAPLVDYEFARVRARAYRALGRARDARLHANLAVAIAEDQGWRLRVGWARTEFGLGTSTGSREPRAAVASTPSGAGNLWAAEMYGRRLRALHQVSLAAASVLDPEKLSRVALDEVVRIFAAERAFLFLVDPDTGVLRPHLGRDSAGSDLTEFTEYGASLVERVRENAEALVVTGSEEGAALGSQSSLIHGLRSIMVVPMQLKGRLLGVVYLDNRAARGVFTPEDVDILLAITNQVGVAITTAWAAKLELDVHAAQRERDVAEMLRAAMAEMASTLDPDEVGLRMIEAAGRETHCDNALLIFYDSVGGLVAWGRDPADQLIPVDHQDPVVDTLLASPGPTRGTDARHELGGLSRAIGEQIRSWLAIPLLLRGERRGLLLLGHHSDRGYSDSEVEIAAALAGQGMSAYETAVLFRQIQELAVRDGLTGLYNRRHFFDSSEDRLRHRQRQDSPVAAVMVDIDNFKIINDTYGHAVGDDVIRQVAERLRACLRADDLICRYGGEEFAILLAETSAAQAEVVAERLRATVAADPVISAVGPLMVTVSVGLAGPAQRESDLHALLNLADDALYAAKRAGRNRVANGARPGDRR